MAPGVDTLLAMAVCVVGGCDHFVKDCAPSFLTALWGGWAAAAALRGIVKNFLREAKLFLPARRPSLVVR